MSLSSLYLDAFQMIAQEGGFSQATEKLNVSQSALSQRIKNLEQELGLTLFIRVPTGVRLTEQGERLLRYCQSRDSMEEEVIQDLNASHFLDMAGTLRIGCYSSIFRSVVLPSLASLLAEHPKISCEFSCSYMPDLPGRLQRAEVDFIIMDYQLEPSNLESVVLGDEKFIAIESSLVEGRKDIYLDNDSRDQATEMFFKAQTKKKPSYSRAYYDDCYGIIDGVKNGLGRAVMSEHLVRNEKGVGTIKGFKSFKRNVTLHYYKKPFQSRLHKAVIEALMSHASKYL